MSLKYVSFCVLALVGAGYNVVEAGSAEQAIRLMDAQIPDLVVIDWMLPGMSGVEYARYVRRDELTTHLPLIMLTARGEEADKLQSFATGVDDYLTKPFSPKELIARLKALLRRAGSPDDNLLVTGRLTIDLSNHSVKVDDTAIHLGPTEFRLLAWLVRNADKAFTAQPVAGPCVGPKRVRRGAYGRCPHSPPTENSEAVPAPSLLEYCTRSRLSILLIGCQRLKFVRSCLANMLPTKDAKLTTQISEAGKRC